MSGTVVTFGTVEATTAFVDSNTLQVTVPSLPAGPVRVTAANSDNHEYTFDDAFTVE